ncbi:nucleolar protein,Nop52-domain-containing protein [Lineolata rhizophorae]|uniref:Nucleolar protein,Nop52-domain-containing protein n=1 Tax=Lineolata rhizophorae TaxID=578093 RepID=A0A6A6PB79_9PEZI|nr:nucleolar protein,Nop52-domain-containing protein [Lineolata rhizophorae]
METSTRSSNLFVKQLAANGMDRSRSHPPRYPLCFLSTRLEQGERNFRPYPPILTSFVKPLIDKRTRDKALDSLRTFLASRHELDELELLKLWKGLFYCVWMSDKVRTQRRLAIELAELVDVLQGDVVLPFLDAFWKTMAREWPGIDVLRMDKFLFLVRQYLAASFRYLAKNDWSNHEAIKAYMDTLAATPLNPTDAKIPNGLRYHVLDIYVDELDKVDADRDSNIPLDSLLRPLKDLEDTSPNKVARGKVKEALGDERLNDWRNKDDSGDEEHGHGEEDSSDEWGGLSD